MQDNGGRKYIETWKYKGIDMKIEDQVDPTTYTIEI